MTRSKDKARYFDEGFAPEEQLPRKFSVDFTPIGNNQVRVVSSENCQLGDVINDNSNDEDFYRYHDIFHYSFATILGWSPCTRSMMKRKRKSDEIIDKVEDGARATITEEAISLIIFNEAKRKNYFSDKRKISRTTLRIIKEMTETFEVRVRSTKDWENAIKKAYQLFRLLVQNKGGRVEFNLSSREMQYTMIGKSCI
jgi:hypothetical protein